MYQNTPLFPTQASPNMDSTCILQTHQASMGLCPNLSTRHFVQLRQYIKPCIFCCQSNKGYYSHLFDLAFILKIYLSVSTWILFIYFFYRIYHTGHTFDLVSLVLFSTLRFLDFLYSLKILLAKNSLFLSSLSYSFSNAASSYGLAFNILPQICSLKFANSLDAPGTFRIIAGDSLPVFAIMSRGFSVF